MLSFHNDMRYAIPRKDNKSDHYDDAGHDADDDDHDDDDDDSDDNDEEGCCFQRS
jgi:hypothetical protein